MKKIAVIGAGPAGISASFELSKREYQIDLHEKSEMVGGLARTIPFLKSRFDVGPHRFLHTKRSRKIVCRNTWVRCGRSKKINKNFV